MPPRVTRASARLTAGSPNPTDEQPPYSHPPLPSRKRKATKPEPSPEPAVVAAEPASRKRPKRIKAESAEVPSPPPEPRTTRKSGRTTAAMTTPGYVRPYDTAGHLLTELETNRTPSRNSQAMPLPLHQVSESRLERRERVVGSLIVRIQHLTNSVYRYRRYLIVNRTTQSSL
jgi:hypothetical protein